MLKDLEKMLELGILDDHTADAIRNYYANKKKTGVSLLTILSIIGVLMISLGIILLISHNWDQLSISTKTFISFIPLVISIGLCFYALWKKPNNITWIESCSVLLIFAVGINYALISQIYNIPGTLNQFLFIWLLSAFPIIYIMRSSMAATIYLLGLFGFTLSALDVSADHFELKFLGLFLLVLPYYIHLIIKNPRNNYLLFMNYLVVLSIFTFMFNSPLMDLESQWLPYCFLLLFQIEYLIGNLKYFKEAPWYYNAYKILGFIGMLVILYIFSFDSSWELAFSRDKSINVLIPIIIYSFLGIAVVLSVKNFMDNGKKITDPANFIYLPIILLMLIPSASLFDATVVNILILALGIFYIQQGIQSQNLKIMNLGLILISILILLRFVDSDIDFVARGVGFILVGVAFLITNLIMIKKMKKNEN